MKMKLMIKIDFLIGVPVCYVLAGAQILKKSLSFKQKPQSKIKKILIIKFLGIGSITLTAPAILALRDEFPDAEIYYLTFKNNKEVIDLLGLTQKNFYIDIKSISSFFVSTIQTLLKLRKEKIDLMLDFEFFSKLPLIIGALGRIKYKAGFCLITEWWRRYLLTSRGFYNHYYHVKDIFLSLVYLVRYNDPYYVDFEAYRIKYNLPISSPLPETLQRAKKIIDKIGVPEGNLLIAVNPNAGPELAPQLKRWPAEYFVELINKISDKYPNVFIVLIGSKGEKAYVQAIADKVKRKNRVINIAGETTLTQLSGLLSLTDLFITVDSGPMHLASLTRTATIGLFGAETPVLYGPLNERAKALCKPLYSVPMFTVYNGKESMLTKNVPMELLGVEEVFRVAEKYLDKQENI